MQISFVKDHPKDSYAASEAAALLISEEGMGSEPFVAHDKNFDGALTRACATSRFKGSAGQIVELLAPPNSTASRFLLSGLGSQAKLDANAVERAAGHLVKRLLMAGPESLFLDPGQGSDNLDTDHMAAHAGLGAILAAYRFHVYRTRLKPEQTVSLTEIVITCDHPKRAQEYFNELRALADGVIFARDLVSEPPNILHPEEFAKRCQALTEIGVEVEVLDVAAMTKLGMGALLGVGQGSVRPSQLVIMNWRGGKKKDAPLAVIGKGVCFDTGGISLKPPGGMDEMKGDMGGAAAVAGLMTSLAKRNAKANVVGILGLVENMPDGNAQRPGDIVTSMSGQTIEVLNTDAEGRLVLADAIWYAQERFKPSAIVDLATLTGAIIIALGHEYAGLFANDDSLADAIIAAGRAEAEPVWRFPLGAAYDKQIDSPNADMKNIGRDREAGSITAAQFIQRFVKEGQPWAHLDIAGTAWKSNAEDPLTPAWATGYGVRLLNRLVRDHCGG